VLRPLEHKPASALELDAVKTEIVARLAEDKSKKIAVESAKQIKSRLQAGENIEKVAAENKLTIKKVKDLTRRKSDLPEELTQAIFKAAKPVGDKPSIFVVPLASGEQVVVSLTKVKAGEMSDDDKKQLELAKKSIGNAYGQIEFNAVLNSLQADADVSVNVAQKKVVNNE
jgi:peptidyl-prolyl cis-trans isomerase D